MSRLKAELQTNAPSPLRSAGALQNVSLGFDEGKLSELPSSAPAAIDATQMTVAL